MSTHPAESNNLQHTCCKFLDSATCIPMQFVGLRLTHSYFVHLLISLTSVHRRKQAVASWIMLLLAFLVDDLIDPLLRGDRLTTTRAKTSRTTTTTTRTVTRRTTTKTMTTMTTTILFVRSCLCPSTRTRSSALPLLWSSVDTL